MKKILLFSFCASLLVAFTSCGSSKSAYRKAYEKAQQQAEAQKSTTTTPTTTPVVAAPVQQEAAPAESNVRTEKVSVVSGDDNLKDYNVVAGSFGKKANAENLRDFLVKEGFSNATIAFNAENGYYRVIASSYADYQSAAQARNTFKSKYPSRQDFQGAWLLFRTK